MVEQPRLNKNLKNPLVCKYNACKSVLKCFNELDEIKFNCDRANDDEPFQQQLPKLSELMFQFVKFQVESHSQQPMIYHISTMPTRDTKMMKNSLSNYKLQLTV